MRTGTSPSRLSPSRPLHLVPLVLALAIGQAYGADVFGQPGTPGVNGATPGAAGTNGGHGGDAIASTTGAGGADAYGGNGGHGGDGANGNASLSGGAGGSGGNGGNAISTTIAPAGAWDTVNVRGGAGGNAGTPGWFWTETEGGPPGNRGRGGDATIVWESTGGGDPFARAQAYGGNAGSGNSSDANAHGGAARTAVTAGGSDSATIDAVAWGGRGGSISNLTSSGVGTGVAGGTGTLELSATAAAVSLTGTAWGGAGGDAGGAGNTAGDGATASARLTGSAGSSLTTRLTLQGGAGGTGQLGANGGNGADVAFSLPFNVANTSGPIDIEASIQGGAAGASDVARAGRAGTADASVALDARKASSVKARINASGGRGGDVNGWRLDTSSGTATAGGAARADLRVTGGGALELGTLAIGGAGGSIDSFSTTGGNGASGGDGTAGIVATTDGALASEVSASARGGSGGRSISAGHAGGAGGTARATASLYNSGSGDVTVNVYAASGSGGEGGVGADGGLGADALLDNAASGGTSGKLVLLQVAEGGAGGLGVNGGVGGIGGAGVARLALQDARSTDLSATMRAAGGSGRRGGHAEAALQLGSTVAGAAVNGVAWARGGEGDDTIARSNGNAVARSTVAALGAATSAATAESGERTRSSDVEAFARAAGATTAQATATALSGRTAGVVARSRAEAESNAGSARALSSSTGGLAYSDASARVIDGAAAAPGQPWSATAQSIAAGADRIQVTTTANAPAQGDTYALTGANVGGTIGGPALQGNGAASYASGTPDAASLGAFLANAPAISAWLPSTTVVGAGEMKAASTAATGTYSYVTASNFQFDVRGPAFLTLGLVGSASSEGSGLRELVLSVSNHGTELFSATFTNQNDALTFFRDAYMLLGAVEAGSQDLLLSAGYTFEGPGDFSYGYMLGYITAVPEPQTWMLMLLGLSVVLLRRKAKM